MLEGRVRGLVDGSGARSVAIVAHPIAGGAPRLAINGDRVFHAASTMKLPVLVELERQAAAGELTLDDTIVVRNAFRSLADGSPYMLDPADDSELALYEREGAAVSLRDLAFIAITESSNLATNLLVDRLGAERISATMMALGAPTLVVRRGVEDDAAWQAGLNNTVTAAGLATLLLALARRELVSPDASDEMLAILRAQAFNEGIPAGLPARTVVAQDGVHHGPLPRRGDDRGAGCPAVRAGGAHRGSRGGPRSSRARGVDRTRRARGVRHPSTVSSSASASTRRDTDEHTSGPNPFRARSPYARCSRRRGSVSRRIAGSFFASSRSAAASSALTG